MAERMLSKENLSQVGEQLLKDIPERILMKCHEAN